MTPTQTSCTNSPDLTIDFSLKFDSPPKNGSHLIWPNGIIFHLSLDFPEIAGDFPSKKKLPFGGWKSVVFSVAMKFWPDLMIPQSYSDPWELTGSIMAGQPTPP